MSNRIDVEDWMLSSDTEWKYDEIAEMSENTEDDDEEYEQPNTEPKSRA